MLAAACDEPVVVAGSRTEFAQVVAQPDGRLRFESGVVPQRARKAGGWADIDLGLVRGGDGRWRPAASVADVTFSGGGSGPLVALTRDGQTMEMSWPAGGLPAPVVSGDSATYPEVLADVDLVVRATWTGFSHVLVVKSASAAANPAVRQIRFGLGGDVRVDSGPDGRLRAALGTRVIASADPPVMWDSRTGAGTERSTGQKVLPTEAESTPAAAGDAARTAPVGMEVSGGDLLLRPDADLLTAPDAVFPLYVDPAWSVYKTKWAYATNNGSSNTDYSSARVGLNPDTGALYRSFFQFSTTANGVSLRGKHIESARVQMKLDHSHSCDNTVSSMYWTGAINATPKASWSTGLKAIMATASGHANEAGGCTSIQPDMTMNFSGSTVTSRLQTLANEGASSLTVGFTARDANGSGESTQERWKKFLPNDAKLYVDYDTKPGPPNGLQVAGVACPASGALTVGTLSPTLSAVFPDADKGDSLTGSFEWIEVPAGGIGSVTDTAPTRRTPPPAKAGVTPNARATSNAVSIVTGKTYAFRAKGTDKAPYSLTGLWSPWCQFRADTTVPPVTARLVKLPEGPGKAGKVRIESTATDVTRFQYGWDAATKVIAAQGTNPKYADVDVTALSFGRNVLLVKAIDATLNEGNGSVEFNVGRPSPPIAGWGLQSYPGVGRAVALADGQPAPTDSPLTALNVTWADGARMVSGQTATFNGSSSVATSAASVVDTTGSFSVAAWVRLNAVPNGDLKVAVQEGPDAAGFELGVRRSGTTPTPYWSFVMKDDSTQSSATRLATSTAAITAADVGRWTHLAGVYDATEKKIRLYVNSRQVAEADRTATPWSASGRFVVGRGFGAGAATNWWNGALADVQVFDRVLVPHDFTGQVATDPLSGGFNEPGILTPLKVGDWDFEAARPCYVANLKDTCEAPDTVTAWGRSLALTRGAAIGAGHSVSDSGLWLDHEYFPEAGHTESSQEYGRSAVKTGSTPPDGDGNEFTLWQDTPVLRTDDSFSMSVWVMLDRLDGMHTAVSQRGVHESTAWLKYSSTESRWQFNVSVEDVNPTISTHVSSTSVPQEGEWTHLMGVYDASLNEIRLYVNGELESKRTLSFRPMAASGPLLVGRTLWHGQIVDQWTGGIDDVAVFQGAMSDASVFEWFNSQIPTTPGTNVLTRGQKMTAGQYLRSDIGNYQLLMQVDGNLVLYQAGYLLWDTATWGNPGSDMLFQTDGNVVLYSEANVALWNTRTWGTTADRLILRDDGDLVLLDPNGQVLWRR